LDAAARLAYGAVDCGGGARTLVPTAVGTGAVPAR